MLDRQPHQLRKCSSSRERDCAFSLRNHCNVILNVGCTIAGRATTLATSRTRRRVTRARARDVDVDIESHDSTTLGTPTAPSGFARIVVVEKLRRSDRRNFFRDRLKGRFLPDTPRCTASSATLVQDASV